MTHEVMVLCNCDEDPCRMEVYVSDVRIAVAELERAREAHRSGKVFFVPEILDLKIIGK